MSALVKMARAEKAKLDRSESAMPHALKVVGLLDAIATPTTIGTSEAYVKACSRSRNATKARATVESGSAALNVSTSDGADTAMAAFVSRKPLE